MIGRWFDFSHEHGSDKHNAPASLTPSIPRARVAIGRVGSVAPRSFRLRHLLLGAAATTTLFLPLGGRAWAQCAPDNPAPGQTVSCSGSDNDGLTITDTSADVLVQGGATVNGDGLRVLGNSNNTVTNGGTIQSNSGNAIEFSGVAGTIKILENSGTLNGDFRGTGDGRIVIRQNGNFNFGIDIDGNGDNSLFLFQGKGISGPVNIVGSSNFIDNYGTFNNGLSLTGTSRNFLVNRGGAQVSGPFSLTGDGQNSVVNEGTLNNGLTINSDGFSFVVNNVGANISGDIVSFGQSGDTVDNAGVINNGIDLRDGEDIVINRADGNGGTIQGTINLGAGEDFFLQAGGTINGQILLGADDDFGAVTGGTTTSVVQAQDGDDGFFWTGGTIGGLDVGTGTDYAVLTGLTTAQLRPGLRLDGGLGNDLLYWDTTKGDDVQRYVGWEDFVLANQSELTFANFAKLTLGDSGTGTGRLHIDATSRILAGNGTHTVAPTIAGQFVQVENAGLIDLTNAGTSTTDRFVVMGNYVGQNGRLALQTVLGDDNSPSDGLVINGAGALGFGATAIAVTNVNGPGAMTIADGIRVIDAASGALTTTDAFSLAGPVAAGMFEYLLFRGGVTPGTEQSWWACQ